MSNLFAPTAPQQVKKQVTKVQQAALPQPDTAPVNGRPVPVLQDLGFTGGIGDFNTALAHVVGQHVQTYGYQPKPDAALSSVLQPAPPPPTVVQTALQNHPIVTDQQFIRQMRQEAQGSGWDTWLQENGDRVQQLSSDKRWQAQVHGIVLARNTKDAAVARAQAAGLTPEEAQMAAAHKQGADVLGLHDLGAVARPAGQIVDSLVHSFGGLYAFGKSAVAPGTHPSLGEVGKQWIDFLTSGKLDTNEPFARNVLAIPKGVAQDVRHPLRNSGYLFMDILGFGSLGAGGVARLGAARAVAREGRELGAPTDITRKAAVGQALQKPPLKRAALRLGDYTEEMPLSQNPLVAVFQQGILGARQVAAEQRRIAGPSPLRSVLVPDWFERNFSYERKVGREAEARQRVAHEASMTLANEMRAAAHSAVITEKILGLIPVSRQRGLTRGENKAIQALSWDDPNPLEAERAFHKRLIAQAEEDGSPRWFIRNHKNQLGYLIEAENALKNPSERFKKVLPLVQQVIAEQQRMKIEELGLAPETAEQHLAHVAAILRGEDVVRMEDGRVGVHDPQTGEVVPIDRKTAESFYGMLQPKGKAKRPPSQARGYYTVSGGPYGTPPPRDLPELTHEFTGKSLIAGDYRIDAAELAFESYARTVRAITVRNEHKKLWETGSKRLEDMAGVPEEFLQPIRDVNEIDDRLRPLMNKLDEGEFTAKDAELLPEDLRDIIDEMYPAKDKLTAEEMKHVRWQDRRQMAAALDAGVLPGYVKGVQTVANTVNAPFRFFALFARPAYALNKLGNRAMLIWDQGFLNSLQNVSRAVAADELYGERNAATIRALVGAGRSKSYVTSRAGRVSEAFAQFWARFADRDERVASWIYYADRKGYRTAEDIDRLLNDKTKAADLEEVTRRANKALVEFDNLSPFEKNVFRHIIFVYPWVSRSAVWSLRTIMEHPAKTAILAHLGQQEIENDPILSHAPAWFKRVGYFPIGWNHDGTPKVVNPTSVNTFSTLADFLAVGKAGTVGDKYASASDLFGPFAQFLAHGSIGRNQYGDQYPGSQWVGAAKEVLIALPQLAEARARKNQEPSKFDIRRRESLQASLNSAIHQSVFSPGWLNGYGALIGGGFSPKDLNLPAKAARYWADQDPKVRAKRELELLNYALNAQGKFLQREVPDEIRKTVRLKALLTQKWGEYAKTIGRNLTDEEKAALKKKFDKRFFAEHGRTPAQEKKDAAILNQWDDDVQNLYSFRKEIFGPKAAYLAEVGLSPQAKYNVSQERLFEYGRKFVKWSDEVRQAKKKGATAADLRLMTDEHSKPVDGLPSFAAMAWANLKPDEQAHALLVALGSGWSTLTSVEKQLLGKPVDPAVTEAWRAYGLLTSPKELAKQLPAGQRSLDKTQRLSIVKQIDRYYNLKGKFLQDYLFSKQPLYQRLAYMNTVKDSQHRSDWQQLFQRANELETAVANKQTTQTVATDAWHDYVAQLSDYYRENNPGFWKELMPIMQADPSFLTKLIH